MGQMLAIGITFIAFSYPDRVTRVHRKKRFFYLSHYIF